MRTRYLGRRSPEENALRDFFLVYASALAPEELFELYGWSEPCLSLGYHQKPLNFPIKQVRRPTGGGALFHGPDLSFRLVVLRRESPAAFYRRFTAALGRLFAKAGIRLYPCPEVAADRTLCHLYPARGELCSADGRKLVAAALRTSRNTYFLHGTVYAEPPKEAPFKDFSGRVVSAKELGLTEEELKALLGSFPLVWRGRG
ncbi:MAG: hypothetical protein GXO03_01955 [Aquificae bacterium]|nr:hypothetical protein [Aquificota bacterium]